MWVFHIAPYHSYWGASLPWWLSSWCRLPDIWLSGTMVWFVCRGNVDETGQFAQWYFWSPKPREWLQRWDIRCGSTLERTSLSLFASKAKPLTWTTIAFVCLFGQWSDHSAANTHLGQCIRAGSLSWQSEYNRTVQVKMYLGLDRTVMWQWLSSTQGLVCFVSFSCYYYYWSECT